MERSYFQQATSAFTNLDNSSRSQKNGRYDEMGTCQTHQARTRTCSSNCQRCMSATKNLAACYTMGACQDLNQHLPRQGMAGVCLRAYCHGRCYSCCLWPEMSPPPHHTHTSFQGSYFLPANKKLLVSGNDAKSRCTFWAATCQSLLESHQVTSWKDMSRTTMTHGSILYSQAAVFFLAPRSDTVLQKKIPPKSGKSKSTAASGG